MSASGASLGLGRDDVARALVCREDDVREVRALVELSFPSERDAEEGAAGVVLAGSGFLVLACCVKPRMRDFLEI